MFVDILVNTIHFAKHKWNFLFDNFDLFWRQDLNSPLPNPTKTQNCVEDSAKGGCWAMGHICFSTYKNVFSSTNVSTLLVRPSLLLDTKHLSYRIPWASTVRVQLAESAVHGPFPRTRKGPYIPAIHMYEPLHDEISLGVHSASAHPCPYDSLVREAECCS